MNDQDYLNLALASLHSGQWFGWKKDYTGNERMSYENLIVHDSSIKKPTKKQVDAKIKELKNEQTNSENKQLSGKQKFKDLGLDDDEIKALLGV
tara:strand:+ start:273 stop:554 length:282 start_codon:yes stop_codon:yes gene_type:complete